jgi:hypothetical protein
MNLQPAKEEVQTDPDDVDEVPNPPMSHRSRRRPVRIDL